MTPKKKLFCKGKAFLQGKYAFGTIWNMDDVDLDHLKKNEEKFDYVWLQKDKGEKTEKDHYHFLVVLSRKTKIGPLQKLFCPKNHKPVHVEQIIDWKGAIAYLQKKVDAGLEKLFEYGEQPEKIADGSESTRTDLKDLMADIKSGMSISDIQDKYPGHYLRMHNSIDKLVNEHHIKNKSKKFAPLFATYLWGDSDTNKSRYALEMAQEEYEDSDIFEFTMPDSGKVWWDGYNDQKCVIINEFKAQFGVEYFNNLLDGKIASVSVKGSFVLANFERLYITSNYEWTDLWAKTFAKNPTIGKAVYRRLDEIIKFETDKDPVYEKFCPRRVDDEMRLPSIQKPALYTGESMPTVDFVSKYKEKKRKLNELESDTVIDSDGSAMSESYASNPANFRQTKKRKTNKDE